MTNELVHNCLLGNRNNACPQAYESCCNRMADCAIACDLRVLGDDCRTFRLLRSTQQSVIKWLNGMTLVGSMRMN